VSFEQAVALQPAWVGIWLNILLLGAFVLPVALLRAIALPPASPVYTAPPPLRSESVKGIACMALGMFLFSAGDTIAKLLTETVHPVQVVWSRQLGLLLRWPTPWP